MKGNDILSAAQFSRAEIEDLFTHADEFAASDARLQLLSGRKLALLWYEPSIRERASFESAIGALGGSILTGGVASNAEGFVGAVRGCAADAIVLRHPETGAAQIAAEATATPIINAGDGTGEDPTQGLADLYTIRREKKTINGLRIALVGDLKNGCAAHSLALLLARFDVYVSLVAPAAMSLPYDLSDAMRAHGITVEETNDLPRVLEKADAVILSQVDKKYFADAKQYEKMSQFYRLDQIAAQKPSKTWLGGTWDGGESILADVDQQTSGNAKYVRMALLAEILG